MEHAAGQSRDSVGYILDLEQWALKVSLAA